MIAIIAAPGIEFGRDATGAAWNRDDFVFDPIHYLTA